MLNFLLASKLTPGNWENLKIALTILWQGLLAIFVVIAIIIGIVYLVRRRKSAKKRQIRPTRTTSPNDNLSHTASPHVPQSNGAIKYYSSRTPTDIIRSGGQGRRNDNAFCGLLSAFRLTKFPDRHIMEVNPSERENQ